MDDRDDSIATFVGAELATTNALQQTFLNKRKIVGSVHGKAENIHWGIQKGGRKLFNDYFYVQISSSCGIV